MRGILIFISLIVVGGCVASHQSVVEDVNVDEWRDTEYVIMENHDTLTYRNIEIFARYSPSLVSESTTLTINTMTPDSTSYSEEVTIHFDKSPSQLNASRVVVRPYREGVIWRQRGEYRFEITPVTPVVGIEAIGVNITKSNP
ncbi:MAG: hypothetical protein SNG10_02765 [Rikenellaceae bacterium]